MSTTYESRLRALRSRYPDFGADWVPESRTYWGEWLRLGRWVDWAPDAHDLELEKLANAYAELQKVEPTSYQEEAAKLSSLAGVVMGADTVTITIPKAQFRLLMAAIGLCEEAGEFAGLVKKHVFHNHPWNQEKAVLEVGDAQWYAHEAATTMGVSMEHVKEKNLEKLHGRYGVKYSDEASINRKPGDD